MPLIEKLCPLNVKECLEGLIFPTDFPFNMSIRCSHVQYIQKQYFQFGFPRRIVSIFLVFLHAKKLIYLLHVLIPFCCSSLSLFLIVLLSFSVKFKFNFGFNFNSISIFHLNCKISFGFLPSYWLLKCKKYGHVLSRSCIKSLCNNLYAPKIIVQSVPCRDVFMKLLSLGNAK